KILAEGKKQDLETFLLWCRRGPPFAKVNNISHEWTNIASDKFDSFKIKY
ncbi:acylphosphatase, partial [archaeon]|nr:acylphosphatase [archaeon]